MTLANYTRAYPVATSVEIEEDCGCGCSGTCRSSKLKMVLGAVFLLAIIIGAFLAFKK